MAHDPDPYRVLNLSRGASLDDVKRAYRRLAKANHPDAAGEAALPRFLAIQAAYEQLLGSADGAADGRGPAAAARRPWDADPDRSDATRRAYGGRARTGSSGTRATPPGSARPGAGSTGSTSSRSGRRRRSAPDDGGPPPSDTKRSHRSAKSNKATLGSTSYDGVDAGEFEPDWRGASWYGTTSGTYWTLNPKEYADPRKHGPEYQARARRTARAVPGDGAPATSTRGTPVPPADDAPPVAGPTHTTSSWWDSTAGAAGWADASDTGPSTPPRPTARPASSSGAPPSGKSGFDLERSVANVGRMLFDERAGGTQGRIVRAIVGWIPLALAIGWLIGEVSGCGRFAATCDGSTEPVVLGVQVLTLALLLVLPSLAALATIAAVTMFAVSIFAAFTLYTTAETTDAVDLDARAATLGVLLVVAWMVGLILAIAQRARAAPSPTRPVS